MQFEEGRVSRVGHFDFWKGKRIDEMGADELRLALAEMGLRYTRLLNARAAEMTREDWEATDPEGAYNLETEDSLSQALQTMRRILQKRAKMFALERSRLRFHLVILMLCLVLLALSRF